jgi:16S rRNA (uracil1498-N3)-methyltransferase
MNRLLFFAPELQGDRVLLGEPQARHLREVLNCQPGQRLKAGIVNGPRGWLEPQEIRAGAPARFIPDDQDREPEDPQLELVMALPRPQTLRRVLLALPQLGIRRLYLIRSARVEKSFFHTPLLRDGEWRRHLLAGMEQAGVCHMPRVELHPLFRPFVEDHLPRVFPAGLRLLLHPGGHPDLARAVAPARRRGPWCLAVGPEGGWQGHEVEHFQAAGFEVVGLGARILRVETALTVLAGQAALLKQGAESDSIKETP